MAGNDAEIKIGITGDTKGLGASIKEAETTIKGFGQKVKETMESQSASVFKGVASYDVLKQGLATVKDFLVDSLKESADSARILKQTQTNVENAGFAWEEYADKIKQASEASLQLGFDDDTAGESLSKLLLVTKDYNQALALHNLAMDIARNKNIGLEEATKAVTMVTQGNNRALKELGINLSDSASIADQLAEAQDRVKGSALGFAETSAGKLAIVQQQWANIKQEVGDQLMPIMNELFANIQDNLPAIMELFSGLAKVLVKVADAGLLVVNGLTGLKDLAQAGVAKGMSNATEKVGMFKSGLASLGIISKESAQKTLDFGKALDEVAGESFDKALDKGDKSKKVFEDLFGIESDLTKQTDKLTASGKELNKTSEKTKNAFLGIGGASQASIQASQEAKKAFTEMRDKILNARDAVVELSKNIKDKLTTAFSDFTKSMKEDTKEASKGLAEIVVTAEKDLVGLKKSLADEQAKASDQQSADSIASLQKEIAEKEKIITASAGFNAEMATKTAEAQKKIDDLIKASSTETDPIKKVGIDAEIEARQVALDSLKTFGDFDKQIAEERRISNLDEFSRFKEETFAKMELKTNEFIQEVTQLREKQAIAEEVEKTISDFYAEQTSVRQATLDAFAVSSIATLQRIGSEARSALSALQAFQSQSSRAGSTGSGKAMGGYTMGGEMVHAGEYVIPRWIVNRLPSLVGQIESMRNGGGGMSKTVNAPITINANVRDGVDIRSIGSEMGWELGKL